MESRKHLHTFMSFVACLTKQWTKLIVYRMLNGKEYLHKQFSSIFLKSGRDIHVYRKPFLTDRQTNISSYRVVAFDCITAAFIDLLFLSLYE